MKQINKPRHGDVRERLIREAIRLFGEKGYNGTPLQDLADAVGVSKPSLLHHFPSKEALRTAVIDELLEDWSRQLPSMLSEVTGGYGRFSAAITAVENFFLKDVNRARFAIRELLDRPDVVQPLVVERLRPWAQLLTNYIRMGQTTGHIKPEVDPESYIIQVMMMAIGTIALGPAAAGAILDPGKSELEPKIAEMVRIARDALFVPAQRTKPRQARKPKR